MDQLLQSPEFAAQVAEECQRLLQRLVSPELRAIVLLKMEGYTIEEIAAQQDCAPRTIERKVPGSAAVPR